MMNYLDPKFEKQDIGAVSILGLAYAGDCVYELLVRTYLLSHGHSAALDLHRTTVSIVNAKAQAQAARTILPVLDEDETAVYKRGRNAKVNQVPHNTSAGEYHSATGFEALFGWLYLSGRQERINELFGMIFPE